MVKQSLKENWSLSNVKSVGLVAILGMKQLTPAYFPVIIVASSTWDIILFIQSLVPLHNFGGSILQSKMTGAPHALVKDYIKKSLLVQDY